MNSNFDTTALYKTMELWQEELNFVKKSLPDLSCYKTKLNNKKTLLQALKFNYMLEEKLQKLHIYIHLNHDADMSNALFIEKQNILDGVITDFYCASSFIAPELKTLSETFLNDCIQDENFKEFDTILLESLRYRPHTLSDKEEQLLSSLDFDDGFDDVYSTLTNVNFSFKPIVANGKEYELTDATYIQHLENKDREIRRQAFNNYYHTYKNFNETIAANFIFSLKAAKFNAKTRNFESVLDKKLFNYNLDKEIYYALIRNVNKYLPLLHDYYRTCKQVAGINDYTYYDLYISISKFDKNITYDESIKLIIEATAPLSKEYQKLINIADKEMWIDIYPKKAKRSGAYETAAYDTHPYVLTNYTDNVESCFTLIHELGHAMHSYFTNRTQPYTKSDYSIYLAEIASTVNEILLLKHLFNKATDKQEKLYYIDKYIKMFKGTVFRQTMFSEFEDFAHNLILNGEPISMNILNTFYGELNKKYFPDCVVFNENISYEWSRIPHFYSPYYVYNYATSFTAAVVIANKLLNDNNMAEKYLHFLSLGSSKYPNDILLELGIDLKDDATYDIAFSELESAMKQLKMLLK